MFPVRCFTCNKVVGHHELSYNKLLSEGLTPNQALEQLKIVRYCCRRMFLGHVNLIDEILSIPSQVSTKKLNK